MQWRIEGADATTGQDRTVLVSARDSKGALEQAHIMHLMVSSVTLHNAPAPPLGMADSARSFDYASLQSRSEAPAEIIRIPKYFGLHAASFILGISSVICYGVAVIALVISLVALATPARPVAFGGPPPGLVGMFSAIGFAGSLGLLSAAAIQHGLSAACEALRDIARNSFR